MNKSIPRILKDINDNNGIESHPHDQPKRCNRPHITMIVDRLPSDHGNNVVTIERHSKYSTCINRFDSETNICDGKGVYQILLPIDRLDRLDRIDRLSQTGHREDISSL